MHYGFIGAGSLGEAMIHGLLRSGIASASDFFILDKLSQQKMIDKYNVRGVASYEEMANNADIIFVAVKPVNCAEVYSGLAPYVKAGGPVLVSTAAGVGIAEIYGMLGGETNLQTQVIRIMPNINACIMQSTTALCASANTKDVNITKVTECLEAIGKVFSIEEEHFGIFTAIACCSPAFTYMYIDALAGGALKAGMNKKEALKIAAHAVAGSAQLLLNSDAHPYELVDMVCSPAGMTLNGVTALSKSGFTASVTGAVGECLSWRKTKELS